MTIFVDYRDGSKDLVHYIDPRSLTQLGEYDADAEFLGFRESSTPVRVGIEYKKLDDVLKCIDDGRFTGTQLPRMMESYDRLYLVIEGDYDVDPKTGALTQRMNSKSGDYWVPVRYSRAGWLYRQLDNWISTIEEFTMRAGKPMRVAHTRRIEETAAWIKDKYVWWCETAYEDHKSHLKLDTSGKQLTRAGDNPLIPLRPATRRQMVAAQLPGIGVDKSRYVANAFSSIREMVNAPVDEWTRISWTSGKTKRKQSIGPATAEKIVAAINEEEK